MKILVTGAAGCLGSAIVEAAAGRFETVSFDLQPASAGDRIVTGSVADLEAVMQAAAGCDAICHTAGLHGRHIETHTAAQFFEVNLTGVNNLYEAMLAHGIPRLVQSSTMEVVCGRDWAANGAAVLDELTTPRPDWKYPLSKYLAEQLAPYYLAKHGLTTAMLRYMTMDYRTPRETGLGTAARWVSRHDAAEANLLAATSPAVGADVFCIGTDTPLTNQDIVRSRSDLEGVLASLWPGSVEVLKHHGIPLRDCLWPVAANAKAKRVLGWQPQYTLAALLQELRENG